MLVCRPPLCPAQCLSYNGEEALYGRQAIVGKLSQVAMTHSTFKMTHRVREVDCQPLGQVGAVGVRGLRCTHAMCAGCGSHRLHPLAVLGTQRGTAGAAMPSDPGSECDGSGIACLFAWS